MFGNLVKNDNSKRLSVFAPKKVTEYKIEHQAILKTIPPNSYKESQSDKSHLIESRWRFLRIPCEAGSINQTKQIVEISRLIPGKSREYFGKNMKWINTTIDSYFDQFVYDQYYYYSEN